MSDNKSRNLNENNAEFSNSVYFSYTPPPEDLKNNLVAITMLRIDKQNLEKVNLEQKERLIKMEEELTEMKVLQAKIKEKLEVQGNLNYKLETDLTTNKLKVEEMKTIARNEESKRRHLEGESKSRSSIIILSIITSICTGIGINLLTSPSLGNKELVLGTVFILVAISLTVFEYRALKPKSDV